MISFKECLKRSEVFVAGKGAHLLWLSFFHLEDIVSVNNGQMKRWLQQIVQGKMA